MAIFNNKKFRSKAEQAAFDKTFTGKYQSLMTKNPFLFLGLPFLTAMVVGSVLLSNFTAIRYERIDRKIVEMDEEGALWLSDTKRRRKVDMNEEYYRLQGLLAEHKDWEPKRIPRRNGEQEPVW